MQDMGIVLFIMRMRYTFLVAESMETMIQASYQLVRSLILPLQNGKKYPICITQDQALHLSFMVNIYMSLEVTLEEVKEVG